MQKKKKVMKFQEANFDKDRFFAMISLEGIGEIDSNAIEVEMLRVGNFKHKLYGDLEITEDMLEKMVQNVADNVIGRDVSFDWNHEGKKASAWLKEIKVEDGVLIGTAEFTKAGKESVEDGSFAYFSIEYSDDYEDPENGETYGPTIMGGSLTNRPFISKLKKIEFSLDDKDDDVSIFRLELKEEKSMPKKVIRKPAAKSPEMTLEDALAKIKELEAEVAGNKILVAGDDPSGKKLEEFITAQKKEMKALQGTVTALQEANKTLEDKTKKTETKNRTLEIERICTKLLTDDKHHPVVVETVKQILSGSNLSGTIKFEESVGEGDAKKTIEIEANFEEAILRILEAIPASQRTNLGEKTTTDDGLKITEEENTKLEDAAIKKAFVKKGLKIVKAAA